MKKLRLVLQAGLFATVAFLAGSSPAQVPQIINYQGRVAVGSVNFDGTGQFKFALVNANGSTSYWSNDGTSAGGSQPAAAVGITVTKGLYSVLLGDVALPNMTAIPASVFANPDVRLRVWFNDGTNGSQLLVPDQRIAAVGYSIMSANASTVTDGAITSAKIAPGAVGSAQLAAGAVGEAQLADGSVRAGKLAAGSVGARELAANAVSGEFWTSTSAANAPSPRSGHTAIWTGSEMIIWGGNNLNDGARYNPISNTWTAINSTSAPVGRSGHTAVWTGSEMIVWGGAGAVGHLNDGGRYNPVTNTWMATNLNGAPAPRRLHTATWTGSEMIVWGGGIGGGIQGVTKFGDGARYNPTTDSWIATNPSGAPAARYLHTAVWTGSEMILWGGAGSNLLNDGSRYNPVNNSWTATNLSGAPTARVDFSATWTGTRMMIFGGGGVANYSDGALYDPASNSWAPIASAAVPRFQHTAVWTGSETIVWGGSSGGGALNTGERYNLALNAWTPLTPAGLGPRTGHSAVWTSAEMILWGGIDSNVLTNDGSRLRLSNILPSSIGGGQLVLPLRITGSSASSSTLSGTNGATGGTGVAGVSTGGTSGIGVSGDGGTGIGVQGIASGLSGFGVIGIALAGTGVYGESTSASAVRGITETGFAIFGSSTGSGLAGRFDGKVSVIGGPLSVFRSAGQADIGGFTAPIESYPPTGGIAGKFNGPVVVNGNLSKASGSFRIDHPLDPANKYLSHSFVESPDMMNIYNGNVTLDRNGEAVVSLPLWFGALNKEYRYQLTCVGGFAPVYISQEITKNRFKIAGGKPGLKVSWQVTGIRQDAWANAHRIPLEEEKSPEDRGSFLHPELFGQPAEKSVKSVRPPEPRRLPEIGNKDGK